MRGFRWSTHRGIFGGAVYRNIFCDDPDLIICRYSNEVRERESLVCEFADFWCVAGRGTEGGKCNLSDVRNSSPNPPEGLLEVARRFLDLIKAMMCHHMSLTRSKVTPEPIASRPCAREEAPRPTDGPQLTPWLRAAPAQPTSQFVLKRLLMLRDRPHRPLELPPHGPRNHAKTTRKYEARHLLLLRSRMGKVRPEAIPL